jgi:anti-sigma B factor antagonist
MDLVLRAFEHDGVPVLTLGGEMDLATLPRLRMHLSRLAADHPGTTVLVDLDGVTAIDDTGLGALVGGLSRAVATGGDLQLVCSSERLLEQLRTCRLDRVFEIHATLADALGRSSDGRP